MLTAPLVKAQDVELSKYKEYYQVAIKKATAEIKIDGDLSETDWQTAMPAKDFWLKFPNDDAKAKKQTVAKLTYDAKFLYIGIIAYDTTPYIGQSLKRDSRIRENDGVGIILDPIGKKTSGFYFSVTAFNVQADDVLSVNNENLSFSWDNKWYSAVKHFPHYYSVEVPIPFKTLRYEAGKTSSGLNIIRSDRKSNEFHTWTRVPVNFPAVDLGYTGSLKWDAAPPAPGSNISIIPYITGGVAENKEAGEKVNAFADAGLDAKIALSSSLNLDVTLNPDFSQVEVDRQVTNLTRFSIFFPERRNFFLENSDLFSEYGIPPIRPFYSRRIGLDPNGNTIPIIGGLRLTGNVASRTRIGVMSMQTKATDDFAAQNYSAFTLQQQLLKRTTFKAYFFNRQAFKDDKHDLKDPLLQFGRNAGGEFYYVNEKGDWQGWLGFHHAMKKNINTHNNYVNYGGGYFGRNLETFINIDNTGTNYYTDIGFVQRIENYDALNDTTIRLGFKGIYNEINYKFYPKKGNINRHGPSLNNYIALNPDNSLNERQHEWSYKIEMKNTSSVELGYTFANTRLLYHTSFTDDQPLPPGNYNYSQYGINYQSDVRKKFSYEVGVTIGKFFTADYLQLSGPLPPIAASHG